MAASDEDCGQHHDWAEAVPAGGGSQIGGEMTDISPDRVPLIRAAVYEDAEDIDPSLSSPDDGQDEPSSWISHGDAHGYFPRAPPRRCAAVPERQRCAGRAVVQVC